MTNSGESGPDEDRRFGLYILSGRVHIMDGRENALINLHQERNFLCFFSHSAGIVVVVVVAVVVVVLVHQGSAMFSCSSFLNFAFAFGLLAMLFSIFVHFAPPRQLRLAPIPNVVAKFDSKIGRSWKTSKIGRIWNTTAMDSVVEEVAAVGAVIACHWIISRSNPGF